jgi:hypothetical protein
MKKQRLKATSPPPADGSAPAADLGISNAEHPALYSVKRLRR